MKRERDHQNLLHLHHHPQVVDDQQHNIAMANCLMLLSRATSSAYEYSLNSSSSNNSSSDTITTTTITTSRVFECKTCNRQFSSFQALGGHRASHKKPRTAMMLADDDADAGIHGSSSSSPSSPPKPKTHECSICGLEFAIGQALGGHMRRHRQHNNTNNNNSSDVISSGNSNTVTTTTKKSSALLMDLNLTPLENDLEFLRIRNNPMFSTLGAPLIT